LEQQAVGFLATNDAPMTSDLGRVVTGLNLARIAVLVSLLLAALAFRLEASSTWWLPVMAPGVLLWLAAQVLFLFSPAGRGWALASLACSALFTLGVTLDFQAPGAAALLAPLSIVLTLLFAMRVASYVGQPRLARSGGLLILVPLGLFVMALNSPMLGLGLLLVVVFWLAFFSSVLGQVARAVEVYLASQNTSGRAGGLNV